MLSHIPRELLLPGIEIPGSSASNVVNTAFGVRVVGHKFVVEDHQKGKQKSTFEVTKKVEGQD